MGRDRPNYTQEQHKSPIPIHANPLKRVAGAIGEIFSGPSEGRGRVREHAETKPKHVRKKRRDVKKARRNNRKKK